MKKSSLIILALFLFVVISSFQPVASQDKTKEEKEKELQIQEELVKLKKELTEEQKAAQDEVQRATEARQEADKASKEVIVKVEKGNNNNGGFRSSGQRGNGNRPFEFDDPFGFYSPNVGVIRMGMGEGERSSWDFSKSVKESSFSRDYIFDVEKSAKTVVMSVTGDCKTGEIRIEIVMPNGKTYSDIVIDESGNLNWRKSFNITEEENKDKTGAWKYEISASKATGFFKISLQTF